jgi:hypothetical protein
LEIENDKAKSEIDQVKKENELKQRLVIEYEEKF